MKLADYQEADARAQQLINALGAEEAHKKALSNANYYDAYGGADLADQKEFWLAVVDAIKPMWFGL